MFKLDVTLRRAEELTSLEEEIERLHGELRSKEDEIRRMGQYAAISLRYMDQLKLARQLLNDAGLDSSFIQL